MKIEPINISDWIQAFTALLIVLTLIVMISDLRESKRATQSQNILSVVNFLQDEDRRKARRVVMTKLKDVPLEHWTEKYKAAASMTCSSYDISAISSVGV